LICYASFSGNTEETAELIQTRLLMDGIEPAMYRIGSGPVPDPSRYHAMLLGSFTWGKGSTPGIVKDFVYELGWKPPNVYIFGTGDTQFGGDALFCKAADKLAAFYHSPIAPLKIEQSPRGSQEKKVMNWTEGVMKHCLNHCKKQQF